MKPNLVSLLICFMLFSSIVLAGCISDSRDQGIPYEQRIWYVDQDGSGDAIRIQDAINMAHNNDTIRIAMGVYNEHIIINKKLTILGEKKNSTIIDANYTGDAVYISSDRVQLKNITIRHAGENGYPVYDAAVQIEANNTNISNILIYENTNGIYSAYAHQNIFYHNTITQVTEFGLYVSFSEKNIIEKNQFYNNYCSLKIKGSMNCIIKFNTFNDSEKGMYFCCGSKNNTVYSNNFINNSNFNGDDQVGGNNWYNLERKQGNYWDDYMGSDNNGDGIGDEPYNISKVASPDSFPLMKPIFFDFIS